MHELSNQGLESVEFGQTQAMFKVSFYASVGDVGEMSSSRMLLGLLIMSSGQSVKRGSIISHTIQATSSFGTMLTHP